MKKTKHPMHYICSKCGCCYFSDKQSAEECYDSHTSDDDDIHDEDDE